MFTCTVCNILGIGFDGNEFWDLLHIVTPIFHMIKFQSIDNASLMCANLWTHLEVKNENTLHENEIEISLVFSCYNGKCIR